MIAKALTNLPTVVLCVDDYVQDFFELWCQAFQQTGSDCPVRILPFSERHEKIGAICERFGYELSSSDLTAWTEIGKTIYGDEEYRPGLPRSRFFSKLAAFSQPGSEVVFYDVNAIPFQKPENIIRGFRESGKDVLFRWQLSSLGQNIPNPQIMRKLNEKNRSIGRGWSANFFITRPGLIPIDDASEFASRPGIRKEFGTAPEQSFLTHYFAETGVKIDTISRYSNFSRGVSCRSSIWLDEYQGKTVPYSDDGCGANIPALFVKWNGNLISRAMENYWIVRYVKRGYRERLEPRG